MHPTANTAYATSFSLQSLADSFQGLEASPDWHVYQNHGNFEYVLFLALLSFFSNPKGVLRSKSLIPLDVFNGQERILSVDLSRPLAQLLHSVESALLKFAHEKKLQAWIDAFKEPDSQKLQKVCFLYQVFDITQQRVPRLSALAGSLTLLNEIWLRFIGSPSHFRVRQGLRHRRAPEPYVSALSQSRLSCMF